MKPHLVVIAAVGDMGDKKVIGENNQLPWHLPRDLRFFRTVTENSTVIMGRKTYESIGKRTLPRRRNIVITRQKDYLAGKGEIANSLEAALAMVAEERYAFVIGGGELYRQSVPIADHILLTQICHHSKNEPLFPVFKGDTYFPEIREMDWKCVRTSRWFKATSSRFRLQIPKDHPFNFRFLRFDRIKDGHIPKSFPKLFFRAGKLLYKPGVTKTGNAKNEIEYEQQQLFS